MTMNLSPNDFATFCRLKDELVVANNHIRDLEAKNKLLVDKLAQQQTVFTPPSDYSPTIKILQTKIDVLEKDIEELEGNLATIREDRDDWADKYRDAEQRIKELENQLLLAQNRHNALSVNYDDLCAKYEQAKDRLALAAQQRNDSDREAAHWHKQFDDLNDEYVKLMQKHQVTLEELEELQQKCDFSVVAKTKSWAIRYESLEKDFDNYRNEFDERNTKLMIKLGLAHNQSVDLLVATNLIVANLLSEADLDWSVIAAMMQTVGSLNNVLEELSHV